MAADHGLGSVASVPMIAGPVLVGGLNLYAANEHAFGPATVERAVAFATYAGYQLRNHQAFWDAHRLSENLRAAMESRAETEQAKGIIMGATGCTSDEAFALLRTQSQQENIKLRDIAAQIVHGHPRRRRAVTSAHHSAQAQSGNALRPPLTPRA